MTDAFSWLSTEDDRTHPQQSPTPVHVRRVRPDGARPGPARGPAGRRGGGAAPARCPSSGPARFFQGATWLWAGIFLLLTGVLAVLMFTAPASVFLMVSTVALVALVVAGAGASALWFRPVLPGPGLKLRFAPA